MLIDFVTTWFTPMIIGMGLLHFTLMIYLRRRAKREINALAQMLDRFTSALSSRSRIEWSGHLTDQIDAFIEDVKEAMQKPEERERLRDRISVLDEQRSYLDSYRFESLWHVNRSMIEAYPLLGVLGTILALWLAMRTPSDAATTTMIVKRFGLAIDSTFAGLGIAVVLMTLHSFYETTFVRVTENRHAVRELVLQIKRELAAELESVGDVSK